MKICLFCGAGVSTGVLAHNMNKFKDEEDEILALEFWVLNEYIDQADVIMIGPQLQYRMPVVEKECSLHDKPCILLGWDIYQKMNGEKAYTLAKEAYLQKRRADEHE